MMSTAEYPGLILSVRKVPCGSAQHNMRYFLELLMGKWVPERGNFGLRHTAKEGKMQRWIHGLAA